MATIPTKSDPILRVVLPFRLPSWNNLLSVHRWRRKRIRDLLDQCAASLQATSAGYGMPTELHPSTSWMRLYLPEYLKAMGQKQSLRSPTAKSKRTKTKPSSSSSAHE